jgi:guanine deaminase
MCLGAIYWSRIAKVYFGTSCATAALAGFSDTIFYEELSLPIEKRAVPMVQQLADEAKSVFDIWEAQLSIAGPRE